jgi:hypothetical protein
MQSTFRHDRQVDRRPVSFRLAEGKVFPGYVPGAVEVGVDLISARLAPEEGLCRAVAPMHMSALAATLAGVPGIDGDHDVACRFRLVFMYGGSTGNLQCFREVA